MGAPVAAPLRGAPSLARSVGWNLLGHVAPLLVGLAVIPLLIERLGTQRFGLLTLVWIFIGYLSLFDLGLGRALTREIARMLGAGREAEVPALAWTALGLVLALGLAAGLLAAGLADWLVGAALAVPEPLRAEARGVVHLLALGLPVTVSTGALRGVLEAYQAFRGASAMRAAMGVYAFATPLVVLGYSPGLVPVVAALVAGRVLFWLAHLALCLRVAPVLRRGVRIVPAVAPPLLRFGGWMTVTNIVGPLMVHLDRFLIGSVLSLAAVTYYVTPYEVITKLLLLPMALVGVLFPALAAALVADRPRAVRVAERGVLYTALALFPCSLLVAGLAQEGLHLWLGPAFAAESAGVVQWLAAGVLVNGVAQVPFAVVQAAGRARWTAILHALELPFYLVALVGLMSRWGIDGAAAAWTARATVDAVVLFGMAARLRLVTAGTLWWLAMAALAGAVVLTLAATAAAAPATKVCSLLIALAAFGVLAWRLLLDARERAVLRAALGR